MKKFLILIITISGFASFAQQEIMVSQYMFNGLFLNPAYAGSHKYISSTLLHRTQWVNFTGAPRTALLAVDGEIKNKNMGLGLIVSNDRIGALEQTDISANYAYMLKLGEGKLAFGIRAGVSNFVLKGSKLTYWDDNDEVFTGKRTMWLPKFGTGVYYSTEKWYAGFIVPTLLAYENTRDFGLDVNEATFLRRHYYLNGGYVFKLNETFKLKPSTLIKYEPSAPLQADINLNLMYDDMVWIGTSYRTGDAMSFMVEYQTNFRLRVGYAYDMTVSKLRRYNQGSHEIMIGYDFGKDAPKSTKTSRYF